MTTPSTDNPPTKEPLPPKIQAALALIQGLLPAMTAIVGGLWIAGTYIHDRKVEAERASPARQFQAQKPFFEKQLQLYLETTQVVGKLVTTTADDPDWDKLERWFWELYWSELTAVEDKTVEEAMVKFSKRLFDYTAVYKLHKEHKVPQNESSQTKPFDALTQALHNAALELAWAVRASIEKEWTDRHIETEWSQDLPRAR